MEPCSKKDTGHSDKMSGRGDVPAEMGVDAKVDGLDNENCGLRKANEEAVTDGHSVPREGENAQLASMESQPENGETDLSLRQDLKKSPPGANKYNLEEGNRENSRTTRARSARAMSNYEVMTSGLRESIQALEDGMYMSASTVNSENIDSDMKQIAQQKKTLYRTLEDLKDVVPSEEYERAQDDFQKITDLVHQTFKKASQRIEDVGEYLERRSNRSSANTDMTSVSRKNRPAKRAASTSGRSRAKSEIEEDGPPSAVSISTTMSDRQRKQEMREKFAALEASMKYEHEEEELAERRQRIKREEEELAEKRERIRREEERLNRRRDMEEIRARDRRFIKILTNSIKKGDDGHYEMCLPLTHGSIIMPNNRPLALKRFKVLLRLLARDENFHDKFVENMTDMVSTYAEPVPESELNLNHGMVNYIPYLAVVGEKKPSKLRIVFDCSAKFAGVSLNDCLLSGPDTLNSSLGILLRFRKEKVAEKADIKAFFHQFRFGEPYRNLLRFSWVENGDINGKVVEYRMKIHIFGAVSSGNVASFGLKQAARDGEAEFGKNVADFIWNKFYVDEIVSLGNGETDLCARAGLTLCKASSNNRDVLKQIPCETKTPALQTIDSCKDPLPIEKALGIVGTKDLDDRGRCRGARNYLDRPIHKLVLLLARKD